MKGRKLEGESEEVRRCWWVDLYALQTQTVSVSVLVVEYQYRHILEHASSVYLDCLSCLLVLFYLHFDICIYSYISNVEYLIARVCLFSATSWCKAYKKG